MNNYQKLHKWMNYANKIYDSLCAENRPSFFKFYKIYEQLSKIASIYEKSKNNLRPIIFLIKFWIYFSKFKILKIAFCEMLRSSLIFSHFLSKTITYSNLTISGNKMIFSDPDDVNDKNIRKKIIDYQQLFMIFLVKMFWKKYQFI